MPAKVYLDNIREFIFTAREITCSVNTWMSLLNCGTRQRFLHRYWLNHVKIFEIFWFLLLLTSEIIVLTTLLSFLSNHLVLPIMTHMLDQLMVESLKPHEYEYLHYDYSTRDTRQVRIFQSLQVIKASSRVSTGVPLVPRHECNTPIFT